MGRPRGWLQPVAPGLLKAPGKPGNPSCRLGKEGQRPPPTPAGIKTGIASTFFLTTAGRRINRLKKTGVFFLALFRFCFQWD
jgi:hypothetical protein